mgnify:CR=1 FL=1
MKAEKIKIFLLFFLNIVNAFAEIVTIGTVIPLVALIIDEENIKNYPFVENSISLIPFYNENKLLSVLFIFSIITIIIGILRHINLVYTNKLAFQISIGIGSKLYSNSLNKPYEEYLKQNSSQTISDLTIKVNSMISGIFLPLLVFVNSAFLGISILIALFFINYLVTFMMLLIFGGSYLIISKVLFQKVYNNSAEIVKYDERLIKLIQESLGSFREISMDNNQSYYVKLFKELSVKLRDPQCENIISGTAPKFLMETIGIIFICVVAIYSGASGELGENFFPIIAAFTYSAQRLLPVSQQIYNSWNSIISNLSPIEVISTDLMNYREMNDIRQLEVIELKSQIVFKNVSFSYGKGLSNVFKNLNFVIPVGLRVGVVGKTGSGKTTLMDLMLGLIEPSGGEIIINKSVLNRESRLKWKNSISNVPQNIYLSDLTVKENIAFGLNLKEIDEKRVISAAKRAQIHEFIISLPDSYNTTIGERGARVSGGQIQRIGIARALFHQKKIIILDEATSALDGVTESEVMKAIYDSDEKVTMFIIAHRLTTLEFTDMILELKEGTIKVHSSYDKFMNQIS